MHDSPDVRPRFRTEGGRARYLAAYDAVLQHWPVPYEELDLPTRFGPTHVVASGLVDAPPLLLLPSLAGTATVWRANVAALSGAFRTYAVDVIGQPGKSIATRRPGTRHHFAEWLVDLLDALRISRTSIVGSSFGGFLALNQAVLTPERVDKIVLISPAGTFVTISFRLVLRMLTGRLRRRIRRLLGDTSPPKVPGLTAVRTTTGPEEAPWRALMAVTMLESPRMYLINPAVLSREELRPVRAPTLLLIGDQERLYEPAMVLRKAQARMPQLRGHIVPDADHLGAMAQPNDVNARILAFLME